MTVRFWQTFVGFLVLTLIIAGALSWSVSRWFVSPPPKRLMTPVFQMDLVDGWSCDEEGIDWLCTPPEPPPSSSIAVVAMKYRNADDTLQAYLNHLRSPIEVKAADGSVQKSDVKLVDTRRIGGYEWAEGFTSGLRFQITTPTISARSRPTLGYW